MAQGCKEAEIVEQTYYRWRKERRRCAPCAGAWDERAACVPGGAAATQHYRPTQRDDEDTPTQAIVTLASQYGHYGYRRIMALLRRAGWQVGKDRVERIWAS